MTTAQASVYAGIDVGKETIYVATGYRRRDRVITISLKGLKWHVKNLYRLKKARRFEGRLSISSRLFTK